MKKIFILLIVLTMAIPVFGQKLGTLGEVVRPQMMKVCDNELFVVQKHNIFIYSLPHLTLKKRLGKEGEGPGEFKVRPSRSIIISINEDHIVAESRFKIIFFSRKGEYLREIRKQGGILQVVPLGKNFIVHKLVFEPEGKNYFALAIHDAELKEIKEIHRQKFFQFKDNLYPIPDGIYFIIMNNRIFVDNSPEGFVIDVYDTDGKPVKKIHKDFPGIPVTQAHRDSAMADYLTIPFLYRMKREQGEAALKEFLSQQKYLYPEFFPPIRYLHGEDRKLYIRTYDRRNRTEKYIILNSEGKFLKEIWLPAPKKVEFLVQMQGDKNFFSIHKGHYYYLRLNEDDDTWEVHKQPI